MTTQIEQSTRQRSALLHAIGDSAANTRALADAIGVSVRTAHYHLGALESARKVLRYGSCSLGVIWVAAGSELGQATRYLAGETVEEIAASRLKAQRQAANGYAAAMIKEARAVESVLRRQLKQPPPAALRRVQK